MAIFITSRFCDGGGDIQMERRTAQSRGRLVYSAANEPLISAKMLERLPSSEAEELQELGSR